MVSRNDAWTRLDRNDLEVFLLGLCMITGVSGLLGLSKPASSVLLPGWLVLSWDLLLTAGGAAAIAGIYWRDPLDGLLIERAALWPIGAGAVMYSVALAETGQWVPAGVTLLFATAVVHRALRIPEMLRHIKVLQQPEQEAA